MMGMGNVSRTVLVVSLLVSSSVFLSYLAFAQGPDGNLTETSQNDSLIVPSEGSESVAEDLNDPQGPAVDAPTSNLTQETGPSPEQPAQEGPPPSVEEVVIPEEFEDAPLEFNLPQADTRKVRETARTVIKRDLPEGASSRFSANQPLAWYKFHYDGVDRVLDPLFLTEERDPTWLDVILEAFGLYKPRVKVLTERVVGNDVIADRPVQAPSESEQSPSEPGLEEDPCSKSVANVTAVNGSAGSETGAADTDDPVLENVSISNTSMSEETNLTSGDASVESSNVTAVEVEDGQTFELPDVVVKDPCPEEVSDSGNASETNESSADSAESENVTSASENFTVESPFTENESFATSGTVGGDQNETVDTEILSDVQNGTSAGLNVTGSQDEAVDEPDITPILNGTDVVSNETEGAGLNETVPVINETNMTVPTDVNETNITSGGNGTVDFVGNGTNATVPDQAGGNLTEDRTPDEVIDDFTEVVESESPYDEEYRLALIRAIEDLTPVDIEDVQTSYDEESFEVRIKVRDRIGTTMRIVDLSDSIGTVRFYRNEVSDENLLFTTREKVYSRVFLDEGDEIILKGDVNYLPMEFFIQLGLEVVYFKSLPFAVSGLPENDDVADIVITQRGTKFDVDFQYPTGSIRMIGSVMPSTFDLSDLRTVYKEDPITINKTDYRSVVIGIGPNVTGKVKLHERLAVDAPSLANMLVCHTYNFEDEFCAGDWEDVPNPDDVRLSAFAFIAPMGNGTAEPLNVSISFRDTVLSREFFCDGCLNGSVPADREVGVLVQVDEVADNATYNYTEYLPSDWNITDSGGGRVSQLNGSFNSITWEVGDLNGSIFVNYTAVAPEEAVEGVFFSEIDETLVEADSVPLYDVNVTPNVTPAKESFGMAEAPVLTMEFTDLEEFNRTEVLEEIEERIGEVLGPSNESANATESNTSADSIVAVDNSADVQVGDWDDGSERIEVRLMDPVGSDVNVSGLVIEKLDDGRFEIVLPSDRDIRPGVYTVETTLVKDNETFVVRSQFSWGLVSMNTKRSIYRPGDTAEMIFVVLDSKGRSVCDASIESVITDPLNDSVVLSTSDGGISRNPECGLYDSSYVVGPEGNYSVQVSATAVGINTSFTTFFLSREDIPYEVVRRALSKIDPVTKPNRFDVDIDVSSDMVGDVTITEYLPDSFIVSTDGAVSSSNGTKSITWTRSLEENETESVGYTYSVPLEYPQLYALGKARVSTGGADDFEEGRNWFVAVDPAVDTKIKTVEFFINTSAGQELGTTSFWNSTFFISLPESSPVVKNAHIQVMGSSSTGGASVTEAYLNDTLMGRDNSIGVTEWYGWSNFFNASNASQSLAGLYNIDDNSVHSYVLSVRCSTACNATSAKAVITYEYDNATTSTWLNTRTIFVNSTPDTFASNKFWNASRGIAPLNVVIMDSNPSVKSAWVEIGTISDGNAVAKLEAFGTHGRGLQYGIRGHPTGAGTHLSGATAEASFFRTMFNASNVTHDQMVYGITNNAPMPFHLATRCFGDDCGGQYAKLFITYTHTAPKSRTMEFFINNSAAQVGAGGWWNSTFPVKLPGIGIINVTKSFVELAVRQPAGAGMILEVGMTDVESGQSAILMSYPRTTGRPFVTGEAYSFSFLVNGTNHTTLPRSLLYNITDNSTRQFQLSVRCSSACNALTAKAVIDYNFTSEGRGNMIKLFVNSTERSLAANGDQIGNFTVRLPDTNPSVKMAWFEVYHNPDDGGTETHNFLLNGSAVPGSGVSIATSTGAGTSASAQHMFFNATSVAASLYDISTSDVYGFGTRSECAGVGCMYLSTLANIVYDYDATPSQNLVFQFNETLVIRESLSLNSRYNVFSVQRLFALESGNHSKSLSLSSINQVSLFANLIQREIVKVFTELFNFTGVNFREIQLVFKDLLYMVEQALRSIVVIRASVETPFLTEVTRVSLELQRFFIEQPIITAVTDFTFNIQKAVYQLLYATDAFSASLDLQRYFAENLNIAEITRASLDLQRYFAESLNLTEITRVALDLQRYFTDTLSLNEITRVSLDLQRYFSEALNATEITRASLDLQRFFSEVLQLTNVSAAFSEFQRSVTDILSLTEISQISLDLQRYFTETLNLTEITRVSFDLQRYFAEQLNLADISRLSLDLRLYFADILNLTDAIESSLDLQRYFSEALGLTESSRSLIDLQRYFAESLNLTEFVRVSLDLQRYFVEQIRVTDLSAVLLDVQRFSMESLNLAELSTVSLDLQRFFSETLSLTELARVSLDLQRFFSETLSLTELARVSLDLQRFFSEALNIAEISVSFTDFQRFIVDSLNLTEISRVSLDLQRYFVESLSLTDISVSVSDFQRYALEYLGAVEISQISLDLQRYFAENLNIAEITRVSLDLQRFFSESLVVTEIARVSLDLQRFFAENLNLVELNQIVLNLQRYFAETLVTLDTSRPLLDLQRYFSESLVVTEIARFSLDLQRYFSENLSLADLSAASLNLQRYFTESLNLVEVASALTDFQRYVVETLGITEASRIFLDIQRFFTETLQMVEIYAALSEFQRSSMESIEITEFTRVALDLQRYFSESLGLTEVVRVSLDLQRFFSESLSLTDTARSLIDLQRYFSESISLIDIAVSLTDFQRTILDSLSLNEITRVSLDLQRYFTDALSLDDASFTLSEFQRSALDLLYLDDISRVSLDLQRFFSDAFSLNDISRTSLDLQRYFIETLGLTDFSRIALDLQRFFSESLNITEFNLLALDMQRYFSESLGVTEFSRTSLDVVRFLSEQISVSEYIDDLFDLQRSLTEALYLDSLSAALSDFQRYASESLSLAEIVRTSLDLRLYFTENLVITELSRASLDLSLYISEQLNIVEISRLSLDVQRYLVETLNTAEVTRLILDLQRYFAERFSLTESLGISLGSLVYFMENINVSDLSQVSLDLQRSFVESIGVNETMNNLLNLQRYFAESLSLNEFVSATSEFRRNVVDLFNLDDFLRNALDLQRSFSEQLVPTEIIRTALDLQRYFVERLSSTEITRVSLDLQRYFAEALNATEIVRVSLELQRFFTESLNATETIRIFLDLQRYFVETLNATEITRVALDLQRSFTEALNVNEIFRITLNLQRYFAENLNIAEITRVSLDLQRYFSESLNLSESSSVILNLQRYFAETLNLTEVARVSLDLQRLFYETLNLEEYTRVALDLRLYFTDRLSLTEMVDDLFDLRKSVSDSIFLTDVNELSKNVQRTLSESLRLAEFNALSLDLRLYVADILSLRESVDDIFDLRRSFIDYLSLADANELSKNVQRTLSESLRLAEFNALSLDLRLYFTEIVNTNEIQRTILNLQRYFSESLDITEIDRTVLNLQRYFNEMLNATEVVRVALDLQRYFSENLSLTEVTRVVLNLQRYFSETLDLTESIRASLNLQRYFIESLDATETTRIFLDLQRYFSEAINTTEITRVVLNLQRYFSESLGLSEADRVILNLQRYFSESLDLSEAFRPFLELRLYFTDLLGLSEDSRSLIDLQRIFTERLYIADSINDLLNLQRTLAESPIISDLSVRTIAIQRYFSDTFGLTELAVYLLDAQRTLSESLVLSDITALSLDLRVLVYENLGISDLSRLSLDLGLYVSDGLQLLNISTIGKNVNVFLYDLFNLTDLQNRLLDVSRDLYVAVSLTDLSGFLQSINRIAYENLGVTDFTGVGKVITIQTTLIIEARDAATGTFIEFVQEVIDNIVDIVTGGGGGGGGGATGERPLPQPPQGVAPIKIEKVPIILSALPSEVVDFNMPVRNDRLGPAVFSLGISGIPGEWVTVTPFSINLSSGEAGMFNVKIVAAAGSPVGDYLVKVTVTDGQASEEASFLMRVEKSTAAKNRPSLSRDIDLDTERNMTNIVIKLSNSNKTYKQIQFVESIDKSIARSTDEITFGLDNVPRIIERDPVVMYTFNDVSPGKGIYVSYSVRGIVQDISKLVYWPFEQIMFVEDSEATGFRADEPSEVRFTQGFDNEISIRVKNLDSSHHEMVANLDVPEGWTVSPDSYPADFGPYEEKQIGFRVNVPSNAEGGRYIATVVYHWDGTMVTKDVVVEIQPVARLVAIWVVIAIVVAGIVGAVLLARALINRPRMEKAQMRRIRDLRDSMVSRPA